MQSLTRLLMKPSACLRQSCLIKLSCGTGNPPPITPVADGNQWFKDRGLAVKDTQAGDLRTLDAEAPFNSRDAESHQCRPKGTSALSWGIGLPQPRGNSSEWPETDKPPRKSLARFNSQLSSGRSGSSLSTVRGHRSSPNPHRLRTRRHRGPEPWIRTSPPNIRRSAAPSRTFTTTARGALTFHSVEDVPVPTLTEIRLHLKGAGMDFQAGFTCLVGACPFCSSGGHAQGERDQDDKKMFINMTTGHSVCQCTRVIGSWQGLHDSMAIAKQQDCADYAAFADPTAATSEEETARGRRSDMAKVQEVWAESVELGVVRRDVIDRLRESMGIEQITTETLVHFNARYSRQQKALVLPLFGHDEQLQGVKVLEVKKVKEGLEVAQTLYPRHGQLGLFGFHLIGPRDGETVLVSNVLDALAVHQMTGRTVLALPNGSACLPQQILPLLEPFHQITLWFGNDMRSWEAAKQFARKLNTKRCHFIRPLDCHPPALVALQQGLSLGKILQQANAMSHKSIVSFRSLRDEVLGELSHSEQVAGVKWKRFPMLNKLLKGHRRGELTVFTGPTGSGKTTFMAEYSLDLCIQGVNTLWGSFEIQNVRLAKVMLTQFAQLNLEKNIDKFDKWADRFELLPLYFMTFHGQQTLKTVMEAMSHAVYVHDIEHVIVDNLQFMVGYSDKQFGLERFAMYDHIIAAFRKFATSNNCHVTVVIHPRKENASEELQTASIFGSAKASQEADNVMILQDRRLTALRGRKYIQIVKNRFDGDLGIMPLYFNKESRTMSPPSKLRNKKATGAKTSKPEESDEADDSYELFEELMLVSRQEDELGRGE